MHNHVCWICKANTGHKPIGDPSYINDGPVNSYEDRDACAAYRCTVCGGISVAILAVNGSPSNLGNYFLVAADDDLLWRPDARETQGYPDVPPHIAEAATEAYECHASQHYRASILLARAVIEATAKDKGVTDGVLKTKIDKLAEARLIRPHIEAVAHAVRDFGNDMAHGDFVSPVSEEESKLVVQLMGEILDDVYQSPARLNKAKAAYETRKAKADES
ncbi:DUF4145 domain-containing protein [Mycobacteroides chelonae]|uniref:DUF4145 domain-containing protein n=1 Tax=Mycobacteroides chelonae TaxID=1774 RepID=UPI000992DD0E|nr:DUF4145 domain-containing protein [Mycobacteroides chelonae]